MQSGRQDINNLDKPVAPVFQQVPFECCYSYTGHMNLNFHVTFKQLTINHSVGKLIS